MVENLFKLGKFHNTGDFLTDLMMQHKIQNKSFRGKRDYTKKNELKSKSANKKLQETVNKTIYL